MRSTCRCRAALARASASRSRCAASSTISAASRIRTCARLPSSASTAPELLAGFDARRVQVGDADLFLRIAGSGPPLLMLHGYPQTHLAWHRVAPLLARQFTVVLPDLRGYGQSRGPTPDDAHRHYSKRTMAGDMVRLMTAL